MNACPYCGTGVSVASKVWQAPSKSGDTAGEAQFLIGAFTCPACRAQFNAPMPACIKSCMAANVKNKVERIMRIQGELMQTIKALKEKIVALEAEKTTLMDEIEAMRKAAEVRVSGLEAEVSQMREEAKSLRELVGKAEPAVLMPPKNPPASG